MRQVWDACRRHDIDVVHSFGRLAYLLPILRNRVLKIQSYQRHVAGSRVALGRKLSGGTLLFSACSSYCAGTAGDNGAWHVVFNGAPRDVFTSTEEIESDAPLMFLGRMERIKGPHTAIHVAKASGRKLMLAGNIPDTAEARGFFAKEIEPHLDGKQINYVGPVEDAQKNILLGKAFAFLMPIEWGEPFGIVMAEALACGTPVLGFPLGAVPEVVKNGVNGFLCHSVEDMVNAVERIPLISRAQCRKDFEERFSDRAIVLAYEALYRQGLEGISARYGGAESG